MEESCIPGIPLDMTSNGEPGAHIMYLTPEIAIMWRERYAPNRPLSRQAVKSLSADMNAGEWKFNGETLKFNTNLELFDGQHRVEAVIESGCSMWTWVVFNVAEPGDVDGGRPRKASDVLACEYLQKNAKAKAAVAKLILRYRNTDRGSRLISDSNPCGRRAEVVRTVIADDMIAVSVSVVGSAGWTGWVPPAAMAFVHYMGCKTSPKLANMFVEQCRTGENLPPGSPPLVLRETLMRRSRKGQRAERRDVAATLAVKAWLAYEGGASIKSLRYGDDEQFPRFRTNWPDPD